MYSTAIFQVLQTKLTWLKNISDEFVKNPLMMKWINFLLFVYIPERQCSLLSLLVTSIIITLFYFKHMLRTFVVTLRSIYLHRNFLAAKSHMYHLSTHQRIDILSLALGRTYTRCYIYKNQGQSVLPVIRWVMGSICSFVTVFFFSDIKT